MNIVIIEDEKPAQDKLVRIIEQLHPEARIKACLASNREILKWFAGNDVKIDLIFSDIQLTDGDVFEALDRIDLQIPIIFITAYNQFLLHAFQSQGIGYIIKPYRMEDVKNSIDKYHKIRNSVGNDVTQGLRSLIQSMHQNPPAEYSKKITSKIGDKFHLIDVEETMLFYISKGVVFARQGQKEFPLLYRTLGELEEKLDPKQFFRINRTEIVNIDHVSHYEPYFNDRISLKLRHHQPPLIISASRTSAFRQWIG